MPLSAHLDKCCKTYPKFSIFPFFKMQNDNVSARLSKEVIYTVWASQLEVVLLSKFGRKSGKQDLKRS